MIPEWREFLCTFGAVFDDGTIEHFGAPGAEAHAGVHGDIIVDLDHLGLIAVRGADARTLLQGQLTSDIRELNATRSQLGAWCNPKGQVVVIFRLFQHRDEIFLQLPRTVLDATLNRLRMFVLRADVQLRDASNELLRIGLSGEHAVEAIAQAVDNPDLCVDQVADTPSGQVLRLPGVAPRYELLGPLNAMREIWRALAAGAQPAGPHTWALLDILAGVPEIRAQSSEAYLPQMLGLERLGGLSFSKGCYVGQEIVARTQHRGRRKRQMYLVRIATQSSPAPGTPVYLSGGETTQAAGAIVTAQVHPDGDVAALAVLHIESAASEALRLGHLLGPEVAIQAFGYAPRG